MRVKLCVFSGKDTIWRRSSQDFVAKSQMVICVVKIREFRTEKNRDTVKHVVMNKVTHELYDESSQKRVIFDVSYRINKWILMLIMKF